VSPDVGSISFYHSTMASICLLFVTSVNGNSAVLRRTRNDLNSFLVPSSYRGLKRDCCYYREASSVDPQLLATSSLVMFFFLAVATTGIEDLLW
jgi:hypothetical protein